MFRITIKTEKAQVIKVPKSGRSAALIHPLGKDNDMYNILPSIDLVWTQMVEFSPDLFFIHPGCENCRALQELFMTGPINPKVVIIPYNPLIAPPFEVIPLWPEFWVGVSHCWRWERRIVVEGVILAMFVEKSLFFVFRLVFFRLGFGEKTCSATDPPGRGLMSDA